MRFQILALLGVLSAPLVGFGGDRPYHVNHYAAHIEPDLAARTIRGRVRIDLIAETAGNETLELDRGALNIVSVSVNGRMWPFRLNPEHLLIHAPIGARVGRHLAVTVVYSGAPRFGLQFAPESS
jgi:aminopeptidase N